MLYAAFCVTVLSSLRQMRPPKHLDVFPGLRRPANFHSERAACYRRLLSCCGQGAMQLCLTRPCLWWEPGELH